MDFQQTNILSMTGNSDFATTADLAGYVDLTTSQVITSGIKTFNTLPQSSAVPSTGNQLVNKTYVDGAFCTLGTTQTLTGAKTFNVNVRLNNTRNLIFGTTTGAVLNFTGANMYYDNQAGGGHYFFISGSPNLYIDTTGLNIESGKRIWFNGARCSITDNGTQLVYDVPTGNSHSFRTNNVQRLTIDGNGISLATDNRIFFASGSRIVEEASFSNILYDTPTGFKHQFRVNNVDAVSISSDTNGTLFTFPDGTIMREYTSFDWFLYQLPAGHTLKYQVGGNDIFEIQSGGAILYEGLSMRNGKSVIWNEGFVEIAQIRKDSVNKYLEYEVASTYRHRFSVNNVESFSVDASGVKIPSDLFARFGLDTITMGYNTTNTSLEHKLPAGASNIYRWYNGLGEKMSLGGSQGLRLTNIDLWVGNNQGVRFDASNCIINGDATGDLNYNAGNLTGKKHNWSVNSVNLMSLSDSTYGLRTTNIDIFLTRGYKIYMDTSNNGIGMDVSGNINYTANSGTGRNNFYTGASLGAYVNASGITMADSGILTFGTTINTNNIGVLPTSLQFNIPSGSTYNFRVATTQRASIGSTGLQLPFNDSNIFFGSTNICTLTHNPASSAFRYEVPTGFTHRMRINSITQLQVLPAGLQITGGYFTRAGNVGAFGSNVFNSFWTGAVLQCWIDGTNVGNFTISDYRVKENITKARPVLDRLCKVEMIEYEMKDISIFKKHGRHHGFIAHQVQELFPELDNIVSGEKDAVNEAGEIQPQTICAEFGNLYLSAIQELNAKIEAQQAQIDGLLVAMAKLVSQQIV